MESQQINFQFIYIKNKFRIAIQSNKELMFPPTSVGYIKKEIELFQIN